MKGILLALFCLATAASVRARPAAPATTSLGAYTQSLGAPARVAVDAAGFAYITDPQAGQMVVFDAFGQQVRTLGGFARPLAIAVDPQGRIFLSEERTGSVSAFDAQGSFLYQLGAGTGEFQLPSHIAPDPATAGTVYVTDSKANLVKLYSGPALAAQFGGPGSGNGQFDFPAGICVSGAGEVFVVDQNHDRVQVFDRAGKFLRLFSLGGTGSAPSGRPQAAVADDAGRLFVVDTFQGVVKVFDLESGAWLSSVGGFGQSPGQLNSPAGLALDALNRLYVTSANNRRVELFGLDSFIHLSARPAAGVIAVGTDLVLSTMTGGAGPFSWQWFKNGAAINDATNGTLTVNGVGAADGGAYSAVVTGSWGTYTSSSVQITVMAPPAIVSGPQSLTALRGSDVVLAVSALGPGLGYQWRLNGVNLDGAINSTLALTVVEPFQAGSYSVLVSNSVGTVASGPAVLTVLAPPTLMQILSCSVAADQLFHLTINADPGITCAIEATTDFMQWEPLATNFNDAGMFDFADAGSTNVPQRSYRLRWVP